jgi:hypothetical protein
MTGVRHTPKSHKERRTALDRLGGVESAMQKSATKTEHQSMMLEVARVFLMVGIQSAASIPAACLLAAPFMDCSGGKNET